MDASRKPSRPKWFGGLPRRSSLLAIALFLLTGFSFLTLPIAPVRAFINGENASIVIGQPDFTYRMCFAGSGYLSNPGTKNGLCDTSDVAFDSSGNLWVADSTNCRILEYVPPFGNFMSASLVIGQPNSTEATCQATQAGLWYPQGATFDTSGNLWVADYANGRILGFARPFSNGMPASVVIGQANFAFNGEKCKNPPDYTHPAQNSLCGPFDVAFDAAGNLWVADLLGNRVLKYSMPFIDGMSASLVLGQQNFTGDSCLATASGLCKPADLQFDSQGDLWVADSGNSRMIEYQPPFSNGMASSMVIGKPNFSAGECVSNPASQIGLCEDEGLLFDSSGNLWVADTANSRLLEFVAPLSNDMPASLVIGQQNFTGARCTTTQFGLCGPTNLAFDPAGNLWVADEGNYRVLEFDSGASLTTTSTTTRTTLTSTTITNLSSTFPTSSISSTFSSSTSSTSFSSQSEATTSGTSLSSSTTSSSSNGGILEFPFVPLVAAVIALAIVSSCLLVRHARHLTPTRTSLNRPFS